MVAALPLLLLGIWATAIRGVPITKAKSKVPVFNDLAFYAPFSKAADYGPACINLPHNTSLKSFIDIDGSDTQAGLFRSDARKELILSFPGTNGTRDYITDIIFLPVPYAAAGVHCPGCLVHAGFQLAWHSISSQIEKQVAQALAAYPDHSLTISGHSLGGALSELAFGSLAPRKEFRVGKLISYGTPRIGNRAYANYIDKLAGASDEVGEPGNYFRVTHAGDIIPQLLPSVGGLFVHSRTEYWEADGSDGKPGEATTYRCFGQEPADCNNSQLPRPGTDPHVTYAGMEFQCKS